LQFSLQAASPETFGYTLLDLLIEREIPHTVAQYLQEFNFDVISNHFESVKMIVDYLQGKKRGM
jgi:hypothetical protein